MINKRTDKIVSPDTKRVETARMLSNFSSLNSAFTSFNSTRSENNLHEPELDRCVNINLHVDSGRGDCIITKDQNKKTLEEALENERIFQDLRNFSRMEHTEENLEFFLNVANFKKHKQKEKCSEIVNQFIIEGSPLQINIDYETRQKIKVNAIIFNDPENMHPDYAIFDQASEQVAEHIKRETLQRFNNSGYYSKRSVLKPRQFRQILIGVNVLNILMFVILALFVILASDGFVNSYREDLIITQLGEDIARYDVMLTLNARLASYAGIPEYLEFETAYNDADQSIIDTLDKLRAQDNDLQFTNGVIDANDILIELEAAAFNLTRNGESTQAQAIFNTTTYRENKQILRDGVSNLLNSIDMGAQDNIKTQESIRIATICISVCFFLINIPCSIYLWYIEKKHTERMLDLAKALNKKLKYESGSCNEEKGPKNAPK